MKQNTLRQAQRRVTPHLNKEPFQLPHQQTRAEPRTGRQSSSLFST